MATGLAQYWSDYLPDSHREALDTGLCWLVDDFLGEGDGEDSLLAGLLPSAYTLRYTGVFLRMWFVTVLTVGYKLAQREPTRPVAFLYSRGAGVTGSDRRSEGSARSGGHRGGLRTV